MRHCRENRSGHFRRCGVAEITETEIPANAALQEHGGGAGGRKL